MTEVSEIKYLYDLWKSNPLFVCSFSFIWVKYMLLKDFGKKVYAVTGNLLVLCGSVWAL